MDRIVIEGKLDCLELPDVEKLLASFTGEDYTLEPETAEMAQEEPEQAEEGTEAEAFAKQQITEGEPDIDGEQ